jgi:hypothetical protein
MSGTECGVYTGCKTLFLGYQTERGGARVSYAQWSVCLRVILKAGP